MDNRIITNCPAIGVNDACHENSLERKFCYEYDGCILKQILKECENVKERAKKDYGTNPYSAGMYNMATGILDYINYD